jgi:hypothetical protein
MLQAQATLPLQVVSQLFTKRQIARRTYRFQVLKCLSVNNWLEVGKGAEPPCSQSDEACGGQNGQNGFLEGNGEVEIMATTNDSRAKRPVNSTC